ncbi:MAG: CdiA family toxin C-terminal domain-containing protein, partial [Clostridia bacterium]
KMVSARNMDLWLSSILRDENRKTWEKDARAREKPEPPRIAAYVDYGGGFDGGGASRSIEDDEPMSVINSLGYGSELIAQGALQGIEGFSDFIGGGLTGVLQYASSVGGLFPNAFSDEMGKWNEYYLSEGIASDYAASIEERYKPNDFERNLGKINSAFGGMLPAAATSLLGAGGLAAQGIQVISNAGNSASNAYAQSGDVDQSMLYGGLKGLADSAISQIAGGNPFFAKGKVTSALAGAIKNPVIKKVAQNIYDVAGEGVEGGLMTALDPLLQRMSFNENAENAGIGEIAESAVFDSLVSLGLKSGVRLSDMFVDGKIDKNLFSDYYGDRVKTKAYDLAAGDGNTITAQYDSSTARHVISGDGITKNGVSGAHNGDNFKKAIRNYGVAPIQGPDSVTNHPTIKGIYNQKYLIPRNDGMGMRAKIFKKTLYDPRIISNKKMMRWSNEALSRAQIEMGSNGSYTIAGKAENGLKFNGFIRDGRITSFYPVIKKD